MRSFSTSIPISNGESRRAEIILIEGIINNLETEIQRDRL